MTTIDEPIASTEPVAVVRERLNDPAVAAALVTILDNAELLSTLVLGLAGVLERGDVIIESVASGVAELKEASGGALGADLPRPAELAGMVNVLAKTTPVIEQVVDAEVTRTLVSRLDDPTVAESVATLLDNLELLATVVRGVNDFLERGDTIADSLASGVAELKAVGLPPGARTHLPTPAEVTGLISALARSTPVITEVLDSSMVNADTVALLSMVSDAAAEGAQRARESSSSIKGLRATLRTLKDPEVARGLGLLVEISKSLGRRLGEERS